MSVLTTLEVAKEWLGLNSSKDDALLDRLVASASSYVQQWLNRTLLLADHTETRDGNGGPRLMLAEYPVLAVTAVSIDGQAISPSANPLLEGFAADATSVFLRGRRFTRGAGNVVVSYTAGYATVPPDVEQAVVELVGRRYRERDRIGMVSKGMAGETTAYSQRDMSDAIASTLAQYKRVIPL